MVNHAGGINRIRSCPQQPAVVAVWGDGGQVKILDGSKLLKELADEVEPSTRCMHVEGSCVRHACAQAELASAWGSKAAANCCLFYTGGQSAVSAHACSAPCMCLM